MILECSSSFFINWNLILKFFELIHNNNIYISKTNHQILKHVSMEMEDKIINS